MEQSRLDRIARSIAAYKTGTDAGCISLADVEEVVIVMSDEPVDSDMSRYASKNTQSRPSNFSLNEVRELLALGRYSFKDREDEKSRPERIGIGREEGVEIIAGLTYSEFDKTIYERHKPPADVYKKPGYVRKKDGKPIDLYIKFTLKNNRNERHVLIISFHRDGE